MRTKLRLKLWFAVLLYGLAINLTIGVPVRYLPMVIYQPDGTKIECFASGDEFHNWLHDADGYTIMQHPQTGYYVYAIRGKEKLIPSKIVVGKGKPSSLKGIEPFLNISKEEYIAKRQSKRVNNRFLTLNPSKTASGVAPLKTKDGEILNNIVIFIRFADDNVGNEPFEYYQNIYNGATQSVSDYYTSVSYNKFTVNTIFYPTPNSNTVIWYQDSQNRNYYRPYNASTNPSGYDPEDNSYTSTKSQTYREHTLLKNAVEAVANNIPSDLNIDINNDGYVDVVSFIIAGTNDSWNDLLWPHQWSLWSKTAYINGKQVGDYTLQLQFFGNSRIDLGTLCHEMFHVIGAPDLYHYDDNLNLSAVGIWDIMEGTGSTPQNMGSYMKYLYGGWIDTIPIISQSGTYTLNPLSTSATDNSFIIPSPNTHADYFLVEYRKREAYDASLPNDGMLVYRINSHLEGIGNADGPPDEVYVYRPGGTLTQNGTISSATFNASYNRTAINDNTNPRSFLSDGSNGGLNISNVSAANATISFNAQIDFDPWIVLKNDRGYGSAIGNGATTMTVATRFTAADLTNHVGKYIKKIDFYINGSDGQKVTSNEIVKIWEDGSFGNPGTLVYSQSPSAEVKIDQWTTHNVKTPVEIKAGKEYWVGYTATASSGYPFATDRGPMLEGKGGWINTGNQWAQIKDLNSSLNYNFLIRAIIANSTTNAAKINNPSFEVSVFPNPVSCNASILFKSPNAAYIEVEIINAMGQKVSSPIKVWINEGQTQIPINLNNLPTGFYLLRFKFSGSNSIQKYEQKVVRINKI